MTRLLNQLRSKVIVYWSMTKSMQTGLLVVTGLAGYISSRCPIMHIERLLVVAGSLFLAVSGSTVLNMWYDRDIDAKMKRTCFRALPSGKISQHEGLILGLVLSSIGVGWAVWIDPLFGAVVFAGLFFDVIVYTVWLKRRTAWSIVWGGISGGMPVLAGRVLGTGRIEWVGVLLMVAVLLWIPSHILTTNMRYFDDYHRVRIPTFPSVYGIAATHKIIAISSAGAAISVGIVAVGVGITSGCMYLLAALTGALLLMTTTALLKPSESINFGVFKYASVYMLSAMLLLAVGVF